MLSKKHPSARCPYCGEPLYYGLKAEATGWKVQYSCPPSTGCGREFTLGRIDRGSVASEDDVYERGAELGSVFV